MLLISLAFLFLFLHSMNTFYAIGLMSGTSMDGIDIAYCKFTKRNDEWQFNVMKYDCIPYPPIWKRRLSNLARQSAEIFAKTSVFYGHYTGRIVFDFIKKYKITTVDFIASHGQTIFHAPTQGYTIQIGHGAAIAKETNMPVICDFRSTDMAYGGQGAPIVPIGERDLFRTYKQFVNIGGITNLSIHSGSTIKGYDVCMGNIVMDKLVNSIGLSMDKGGEIAKNGRVKKDLLLALQNTPFISKPFPKTLHADDVLQQTLTILHTFDYSLQDILATIVEHIAIQLGNHLLAEYGTLLTGGGALNTFLVERIQQHTKSTITIPSKEVITMKEAAIIAYIGLLRWLKMPNSLASVTGASKDCINGAIYLP